MPDKHHPRDWRADDTFWDEAWHDMQARLDASARPPDRRRRPLLLVLLLLLLFGAGTLVLRPREGQPYPATSKPSQAATAATSEGTRHQPGVTLRRNTPILADRGNEPITKSFAISTAETGIAKDASAGAEAALPNSAALPKYAAPAHPARNIVSPLYQKIPPVVYDLRLIPRPVKQPSATDPLEKITTTPWQLELGANNGTDNWKPGYYTQLGYRLGGGKTFMPLALRFVRTHRNVTQGAGSSAAESLDGLFDLQNSFNNLSSVADRLDRGGYYIMSTSTLELRSGLGRQWGKVTVTGGMGLHYVLAGKGPAFRSSDGNGRTLVHGAVESLNFSGGGAAVLPANGADELLVDNRVRRWNTGLWLRLEYRVQRRLGISAGVDRLLTSPYRNGVLDVRRSRFDLGLGYRF